ncbi:hypothetical protein QTN25_002957 [Entamoeba marina]
MSHQSTSTDKTPLMTDESISVLSEADSLKIHSLLKIFSGIEAHWLPSLFGGIYQTIASSLYLYVFFNANMFRNEIKPTIYGLIFVFSIAMFPTIISLIHLLKVVSSSMLVYVSIGGVLFSSLCFGHYLTTVVVCFIYVELTFYASILLMNTFGTVDSVSLNFTSTKGTLLSSLINTNTPSVQFNFL